MTAVLTRSESVRVLVHLSIVGSAIALAACGRPSHRHQIDTLAHEGKMPEVVERVARNLRAPLPKAYEGFTWTDSRATGLTIDNQFIAEDSLLKGETPDSGAATIKSRMQERLCANADFVRLLHHGMVFNIDVDDDDGRTFTKTSMTRADC